MEYGLYGRDVAAGAPKLTFPGLWIAYGLWAKLGAGATNGL